MLEEPGHTVLEYNLMRTALNSMYACGKEESRNNQGEIRMNIKKRITEKEEARLENQVKAMNAKYAEKPAQEKKRGRKKKTAITEESSAVVSEMENPCKVIFDQSAKADCGKPQLSLVPTKILEAIARVREYGNRKYKSKDNWKTVEIERYRDAAFRHWAQYIDDPKSRDEESGLPHLWHVACNIAFLCHFESEEAKDG